MSSPSQPPPMPPPAPKKHGCFFYGCLTSIIVAVILGVSLGGLFYYGLNKAAGLAVAYTDTQAMELPKVEVDPAVYEALLKRITDFKSAMDAGKSSQLILTGNELNMLIAGDASKSEWKGRMWFEIKGGNIKCQLSWPLDAMSAVPGFGALKGRYLNGSAVVSATMETGALFVSLQRLEVRGQSVPEEIMQGFRAENLAKNLYRDKDKAAFLSRLASVGVQDDKLILVGKVKP